MIIAITKEKCDALFAAMAKHKAVTEKLYKVLVSVHERVGLSQDELTIINDAAKDLKTMNYYVKKYEKISI